MESKDWIEGYTEARTQMKDDLLEAIKEMEKYGDRKSFKGLSKKDIVIECILILKRFVNDLL